ncbi:hypothetical protein ACQP1K_15100 [Sphaerimonospora sp. CA-214678]|uniref:hypothetical protein n=1 Tax=Sphaerimonospora sp. CA-214678 TaxID=3240029 RepID=UPI003D8A452C
MIRQRYGKASRTSLSACLAAGVSISAVLVLGAAAPASAGQDSEPRPARKTSKNLGSDRDGKGVRGSSPTAGRDQRIRRNSSTIRTRMANMQNAQCQGAKVCNVVQRIVLVVPKNFKKFKKRIRKAMRGKPRRTPMVRLPEPSPPPAVPVPSVPPAPALPPIEIEPAEAPAAEAGPAGTQPAETLSAETLSAETPAAETRPAEGPAAEAGPAETRPVAAAGPIGTPSVRAPAAAPPLLDGLTGAGLGLVRRLV